MDLVLIMQWKCNHMTVKTASLINLIMILTICLAKKILELNSLMKMNLYKKIFHLKFSIEKILINKQKPILTTVLSSLTNSLHQVHGLCYLHCAIYTNIQANERLAKVKEKWSTIKFDVFVLSFLCSNFLCSNIPVKKCH